MFGYGKSRGHNRMKKESNSKKHHIRNWMHTKKKLKHEANLFAVMTSNDPSSPTQASISTTDFDVVDDARIALEKRLDKLSINAIISQPTKPATMNTDEIEEEVAIMQTTLPKPEMKPKVEKNGIETKTKKSPDEPNDECLINCIYYTQQCCDCTIL